MFIYFINISIYFNLYIHASNVNKTKSQEEEEEEGEAAWLSLTLMMYWGLKVIIGLNYTTYNDLNILNKVIYLFGLYLYFYSVGNKWKYIV